VEGYSNLLWVLLAACLGAFGVDLIDAVRVLGVAGMGAVLISVLLYYARENPPRQVWLGVLVGLLFYCLAAPVAVWAIGGMEQPLVAALLGVAIPLSFVVIESERPRTRTVLLLSLVLGLLCITRPDSPIFVVGVALSILIGRRLLGYSWSWRTVLLPVVVPLLFYGGQTGFRLLYYGELVPNTALVKISPSAYHLTGGLKYIGRGMLALAPFSFGAIFFLVVSLVSHNARQRGILLLLVMSLWLAYVAFIGGDFFCAYRHFIPVIVVFTYALIEGARLVQRRMQQSRVKRSLFLGALVIMFIPYVYVQFTDPRNRMAMTERWEWNGKVMGLLLKKAFAEQQPLIAVTAAGCLPYWSELPAVDMFGLNDYYLPRHAPKAMGSRWIGHELGDSRYVLGRKPDLVIFHTGKKRFIVESMIELQRSPEFLELYTPVRFRGAYPHGFVGTMWVRKYSDKIGIRQSAEEIRVPGFLLNDNPNTAAYLNASDELVVPVSAAQYAGIDLEPIDIEDWNIAVEASGPAGVEARVDCTQDSPKLILTTTSPDTIEVNGLVLTRRPTTRDGYGQGTPAIDPPRQ
jgi:arabinofuranosyltransferase